MHPPKYPTLSALVAAVKDGREDRYAFTVWIDNDCMHASYDDDDDAPYLWNGDDGPQVVISEALDLLGLHAEEV